MFPGVLGESATSTARRLAAAPVPGASKGEGSVIGDFARAFER